MNRRIEPMQGWRLVFFQAVVIFSLIVLVLRLGELQVSRGDQFVQDAQENRLQVALQPAPRGAILDRNGVQLARNDPAYNVAITPAELPDDPADVVEVYNRLSALIDVPATRTIADAAGRTSERSLEEMVREGQGIAPFRPVVVKTDIPFNVMGRIEEQLQLMPGVSVQVASVREYPTGELTAHIVGYLGPIGPEEELALRELGYDPAFDRIGYAGIESFFETEMAGQRGRQIWEVNVAGEQLNLLEEETRVAGVTVQLTLDVELQEAAQQALSRRINLVNLNEGRVVTQQGVVIAMDPRNGEVLSLVSWPTYDNSRFARFIDADYYTDELNDPLRPLVNHAISAVYPPGSVWKLITAVGVVEEDVIDPNETLFDPGELRLPNAYAPRDESRDQLFVCWDRSGHGDVNLLRGISESCDVYFYQVGGGNPEVSPQVLRPGGLGPVDLYRWASAFGIGSELGLELPGELAGRMPDPQWKRRVYGESWSTGDTYNAAFGQGYVTVTPLQLINSVAALVNGGILYQPTLVDNLQDANGNILVEFEPQVARTLVPPPGDELPVLLLQEDMMLQGGASLACRCESDSQWYDPESCNPNAVHHASIQLDPEDSNSPLFELDYRVHVPYNYTFNAGVCDALEFESFDLNANRPFIPPFATTETLGLIQRGMREVVVTGTASADRVPDDAQPLAFVNEGGKTGTAEYCDDVAGPLGLCVAGAWPAHAWYVGYAPWEDPEIMVIAFVYNGGEGSQVAAPIARDVLRAYYQLQSERALAQ